MFTLKRFLFVITLLVALQSAFAQETLSPEIFEKVSKSVFEVVILRPDTDSLEYEKRLPLERLSYTERTDKYISIGTAFLLNDGLLYSAAHVFNLREESQNSSYFIRDGEGNIYAIDTLFKFSKDRDFIVFSAKDFSPKEGQGLESVSEKPALNTAVYTVGNALGQGIVIRNGVFTSETFETVNGAWKWVRFSAAASPGNSGGPLITSEGKVMGVVTMKNQNENLNYALPIQEVEKAPTDKGDYILRVFYRLPNILSDKLYGEFDVTFSLPKTFVAAREEVKTAYKKFTIDISSEFKAQYNFDTENSFTNTEKSGDIMFTSGIPDFPLTMINLEDNRWSFHQPEEIKEKKLKNNGSVEYGVMLDYYFININTPDNAELESLIKSPQKYMDYILETAILWRNVAGEQITITSLGEPVKTETHIDSFDRTWLASYWNLEFADYMVVTYAIPVPTGLFVLMQIKNTGTILDGVNIDLAFMSDYLLLEYSATVEDWKEFLSISEDTYPMYPPFANMDISFTNKATIIESEEWDINLPQSVMKVDDKTRMNFSLGYAVKNDILVHELRGVSLYYSPITENYRYISLEDFLKPNDGTSKQLQNVWEIIQNNNYPFNTPSYYQEGVTKQYSILELLPNEKDADSAILLLLETHGDAPEEMIDFSNEVKKAIKINK